MRRTTGETKRGTEVAARVRALFQRQAPRKRERRLVRTLVFIATVFVAGLFLSVLSNWRPKQVLYSSPTAPRQSAAYAGMRAPGREIPPRPPSAVDPSNITRAVFLSIRQSSARPGSSAAEYGPSTFHAGSAAEAIPLGAGSVRIASIGMITETPRGDRSRSEFAGSARHFAPDATPIAPTDPLLTNLPAFGSEFFTQVPRARFHFACSNLPPVKALLLDVFDARTQFRALRTPKLVPAGAATNCFAFEGILMLLHQTPMEIVTTIAVGPLQSYFIDFKEGAQVVYPRGTIRILAIQEGILHPERSALQTSFRGTRAGGASVVFHCWPSARDLPLEFRFLDRNGNLLASEVTFAEETLALAVLPCSPEEVKTVRVDHYPAIHRLAFTMPELPGLPEQNRNLTNLFDARIPGFVAYSPYEALDHLADFVQMDVSGVPAFDWKLHSAVPLQRASTTVRELFEEIAAYANSSERLVVDAESNVIRVERRSLFDIALRATEVFRR